MLLLNLDDLKDLILFCKANKVKSCAVGNINFEISDISHVEQYEQQNPSKQEADSSKTLVDTVNTADQAAEDEELLYFSTNV